MSKLSCFSPLQLNAIQFPSGESDGAPCRLLEVVTGTNLGAGSGSTRRKIWKNAQIPAPTITNAVAAIQYNSFSRLPFPRAGGFDSSINALRSVLISCID